MTDFNQSHIESKDTGTAGYNADEFTSLIEGDVTRTEIIAGLKDETTLDALKAITGEDKDISEVVKESIIAPANIDRSDYNSSPDFFDLCYLGRVINTPAADVKVLLDGIDDEQEFMAKAKEYFEGLNESIEVRVEKDYDAEGINRVGTTTIDRTDNGLEELDDVENVASATIEVEAGASSTLMPVGKAYTVWQTAMDKLAGYKAKFPNATDEIQRILDDLGSGKSLTDLKTYERVTTIMGTTDIKSSLQQGNAILILARVAQGFVETLDKVYAKGIENADGQSVATTLQLEIEWTNCVISKAQGENNDARYVNINGEVVAQSEVLPEELKILQWSDEDFELKKGEVNAHTPRVFGKFNVPAGEKVQVFGQEVMQGTDKEIHTQKGKINITWDGTVATATFTPENFPTDAGEVSEDISITGTGLSQDPATMTLKTTETVPEVVDVLSGGFDDITINHYKGERTEVEPTGELKIPEGETVTVQSVDNATSTAKTFDHDDGAKLIEGRYGYLVVGPKSNDDPRITATYVANADIDFAGAETINEKFNILKADGTPLDTDGLTVTINKDKQTPVVPEVVPEVEPNNMPEGQMMRYAIMRQYGLSTIDNADNIPGQETDPMGLYTIHGFEGVKFKETTPAEQETKEVGDKKYFKRTFKLDAASHVTKGFLDYSVKGDASEIIVRELEEGGFDKNESFVDTAVDADGKNFANQLELNTDITSINASFSEDFVAKAIEYKDVDGVNTPHIRVEYTGDELTTTNTKLSFLLPVDPVTGEIDYKNQGADVMTSMNNKWLEFGLEDLAKTDENSQDAPGVSLKQDYTMDGYTGVIDQDAIKEHLKFYVSMDASGNVTIVNNLIDNKNQAVYEAYKDVAGLNESLKVDELSDIYFDIYQSNKNESAIDKELIASGFAEHVSGTNYQYVAEVKSNSGANTYKLVFPYSVDQKVKTFNESAITVDPSEKYEDCYMIDGVPYRLSIDSNNRIKMEEDEALRLKYYQEQHAADPDAVIGGDIPNPEPREVVEGEIEYTADFPTYEIEELIIADNSVDRGSNMTQEVELGDQKFEINYDENGEVTFIEQDGILLMGGGKKTPSVEVDYLGRKMKFNVAVDKKGKVSVAPEYGNEDGFTSREDLEKTIYNHKYTIHQNLSNLAGDIDLRDKDAFGFMNIENINVKGGDLDRGGRLKGPNRNSVYTFKALDANDWREDGKGGDLELYFKLDANNKLTLCQKNGNDLPEGKYKMPLVDKDDTQLAMNYTFYIDSEGKLAADAEVPKDKMNVEAINPGDEYEFMGETKVVERMDVDGDRYEITFKDKTSATVFGEIDPDTKKIKVKQYEDLESITNDVSGASKEEMNTLLKKTLLATIEKNYDKEFYGGYSKDKIKAYVTGLEKDEVLYDAFNLALDQELGGKSMSVIVADGVMNLRQVTDEDMEDGYFKDTKNRGDWSGMLQDMVTRSATLKHSEQIGLDYTKGTQGMEMFYEGDLRDKGETATFLSGTTEDNFDFTYKLRSGQKEIDIILELAASEDTPEFRLSGDIEWSADKGKPWIVLGGTQYKIKYDKDTNNVVVRKTDYYEQEVDE